MIPIRAFEPSFLRKFNAFLGSSMGPLAEVKVLDRGVTYALAAFNMQPQVFGFPQVVWLECSPLNVIKDLVKTAANGAKALEDAGITFGLLARKFNQPGLGYQKEAELVRDFFLTCVKVGSGAIQADEAVGCMADLWPQTKVLSIIARQGNAPYHGGDRAALYEALRKVFDIPTLEALWDREKLVEFFSKWGEGEFIAGPFSGPSVYFNAAGWPTLIVTESSGRRIHLGWYSAPGDLTLEHFLYLLREVRIEFPGGSTVAAGQVLQALRDSGERDGFEVTLTNWSVYHLGNLPSLE
mgnify:CR=1 FL=1